MRSHEQHCPFCGARPRSAGGVVAGVAAAVIVGLGVMAGCGGDVEDGGGQGGDGGSGGSGGAVDSGGSGGAGGAVDSGGSGGTGGVYGPPPPDAAPDTPADDADSGPVGAYGPPPDASAGGSGGAYGPPPP